MARPHNRFSLGVKIQMSKKLFLAAASVAALTIAGAATAGEISGTVGGQTFTKTAAYTVASEVVVSADSKLSGTLVATNTLDSDIVVAENAQRDHLVTFKVTGAKVITPTLTSIVSGGTVVPTLLSNNQATGEVQFLVTVSGAAATNAVVDSLSLNATIEQQAAATVSVESKVVAVIGATNIEVDTAPSVKAVEYKPLLKALTADYLNELTADLPDYTTVNGAAGGYLSGEYEVVNSGTFYKTLAGVRGYASDILDGATITVKGPVINEDITVALIDEDEDAYGTAVATTDANTAVFNLTDTQAALFASGENYFVIDNSGDDAYRLGTYRVTWAPKAKTGFTVPSASTADSGTVKLEGTNYYAPWVSGTGAANSVVRISNSNSNDSGAVTVRLLNAVKDGAPYASDAVLDAGTVPAGGDLQITSSQLVAAFGAFQRGDIQITINSDTEGFTAKMRNTRDGATFEQSLAEH